MAHSLSIAKGGHSARQEGTAVSAAITNNTRNVVTKGLAQRGQLLLFADNASKNEGTIGGRRPVEEATVCLYRFGHFGGLSCSFDTVQDQLPGLGDSGRHAVGYIVALCIDEPQTSGSYGTSKLVRG